MYSTLRSQNLCTDCGYTWYPRGKDLSNKCPNCGGRNVGFVPFPVGAFLTVLAVLALGAFVFIKLISSESVPVAPRLQSTPMPAWPTAETVALSQTAAVKRFPQLGIRGSRMNIEFIARYERYKKSSPDYFRDPNWPVHLAEEVSRAVGQ